jgi:pimeloyl-ACP methyl ester carboxylesterase
VFIDLPSREGAAFSHTAALAGLKERLSAAGATLHHLSGSPSVVLPAVARAVDAEHVFVSAEPEERLAVLVDEAQEALAQQSCQLHVCSLPLWDAQPAGESNYRRHAQQRGQLVPSELQLPQLAFTPAAVALPSSGALPESSPADGASTRRAVPDTEVGAMAALRAFCGLADDAEVVQAAEAADAERRGTSFAVLFERAAHLGTLSPRLIAATAREALSAHLRGALPNVAAVRRARSALRAAERSAFHTSLALADRGRVAASDEEIGSDANGSHIRQRWWRWRGMLVPYIHAPALEPTPSSLLLVHGFGAFGEHWRRQWGPLSSNASVWCPTLPGFGRSEKGALPYSQELWTQYLADFVTRVVATPVVVAGNSIGGFMCANLAADYPALVDGLVLLNSAGPIRAQAADPGAARGSPPPALVINALTTLLLAYLERSVESTLRRCYPVCPDNADAWLTREIERASSDDGAFGVFASVFYLPPPRALNQLVNTFGKATLILNGQLDPLNDAGARARDLAALLSLIHI